MGDVDDELFTFVPPRSPSPQRKRPPSVDAVFIDDSDEDEDEEPHCKGAVTKNGSKLASLLRSLQQQDKASPKKPKVAGSSPSKDTKGEVLNLTDSDEDDLECNWTPSPSKYTHTASSIVRDSRALLDNMRRNRMFEHILDSSISLDDTPSSLEVPKSMTLRIRIGSSTERFSVGVSELFSSIIERVAEKLQVDPKSLLLTHQTQTIQSRDTPESLGISTTDFIDGVLLAVSRGDEEDEDSAQAGEDAITIRVQTEKNSEVYRISKTAPLSKIMQKFAETIGVAESKIAFRFDGERVQPEQTADDLGMEDEDAIDAAVQ